MASRYDGRARGLCVCVCVCVCVLWQGMDWEGNNNLTLKRYEEPEAREYIRTQDLPFSVMMLLTR